MDNGNNLKRNWENTVSYHEPPRGQHNTADHGFRRQSLPHMVSGPFAHTDTLPQSLNMGRQLPPISHALDASKAEDEGELPSEHKTHDLRLPNRDFFSYSDSPGKRQRLTHEENVGHEVVRPYNGLDVLSLDATNQSSPAPFPQDHQKQAVLQGSYRCPRCLGLGSYVEGVVSRLLDLENNLREAITGPLSTRLSQRDNDTIQRTADICAQDLESSLEWSISSIDQSIRCVRDIAANRSTRSIQTGAPVLDPPHNYELSNPSQASFDAHQGHHSLSERTPHQDTPIQAVPTQDQDDYPPRPPDLASTMPGEKQGRRGHQGDLPQQYFSPPPARPESSRQAIAPSGPLFGAPPGPPQSPLTATNLQPSGRLLPSPSSSHYRNSPGASGSLPPLPTSSSPSQQISSAASASAHAAHLQDLQHQISKKTLALTTLQREHDTLLSAYSRQQTRCATLDKKSQVSDNEINTLAEENIRLRGQVESLDSQVEDLIRARDEAHKQSTANGAQYMQIMAMSGKLQAQGAEEARKWKAQREGWEQEKVELMKRLSELEAKGVRAGHGNELDPTSDADAAGPSIRQSSKVSEDALESDDLNLLRREIRRLRRNVFSLEEKVGQMAADAEEVDRVVGDLLRIRRRPVIAGEGQSLGRQIEPERGDQSSEGEE